MKRKIAMLATVVLSLQLVFGAVVPVAATNQAPVKATVPSIVHEDVEGDVLKGAGSFDEKNILMNFAESPNGVKYSWVEDENGGYLEGGVFPNEYTGMRYSPGIQIPAGKYKITFYVRTVYEGHKNLIYPQLYDTGGTLYTIAVVGITDKWFKVETYVDLAADLSHIIFRGGMPVESIVPYCIDEISIVPVGNIPGYSVNQGASVSNADIIASYNTLQYIEAHPDLPKWDPNEDYEVQGLMLNLDNSMHNIGSVKSEQDAIDWANQFKGTHVTDMVMNFAESKCVYPTEVFFGWYGDKYTTMKNGEIVEVNGVADNHGVDYLDWYNHYKVLKLDYLKTLTTALPEAGINMWLSIRMNDAHDRLLTESALFTRYYFEHPEFRRVQYPSKVNTYYANIWDYSFPEVREKYLALLNESLDRYDVYGFQFEWQREMWLFHPGGEYAGIEIMNQFYRDADAIISIYEEKYGHAIKFSSTVAPDLQTNYDFGLDIMTWASEGIIDMLVPMGRYATTCNETPVALWKSLLEPYSVEVAPCIEAGISTRTNLGRQELDIEHFNGASALYLSQGADKIQLHNVIPALDYRFKENTKYAVYDADIIAEGGINEWWSLFTSCGSYEKLMTVNRKIIPTYNDVQQTWKSTAATASLPLNIGTGRTGVARIGMGDIPEGAKVTLEFSASIIKEDKLPTVYINSEPCEFVRIKTKLDLNGEDLAFSEYDRYVFEVPEAVYDDMFAVVEISPTNRGGFVVDYAEINIVPAE